jgi:DegV family protein with EDD domain
MNNYKILIDSCTDLPGKYVRENNIPFVSLTCNFKGQSFKDDFGQSIDYKSFYDEVRKGEMPTTSQVNVYEFEEIFKKYASENCPIIYISLSSGLSGTYNSASIAREAVIEEYPNADITVVDSKGASMGEGLLAYYAVEMMKSGASKEEVINWLENNKLKINHWFTVDDLNHLKRGGRLSATSAMIGTLLDIKPILEVNSEGKLVPATKVKGRKKSIRTLAEKLNDKIVDPENQTIFISHGDCLNDAELLKSLISEKVKVKDFIISDIGPVIGSHTGPGVLALFFIGENRNL